MIIAKTDDMICQTPLKSITGLGDSFPVIFDRVKDIELNIVRKITHKCTIFITKFYSFTFSNKIQLLGIRIDNKCQFECLCARLQFSLSLSDLSPLLMVELRFNPSPQACMPFLQT